ncbi:MmcQ/YjbR family DNA-binding protein [Pararhodobacter sp.]|uniref:MmcQ/YjbR family DNA-binding protein n=1 Tax=Pararhodobacter sp. TaxID=2127056 RepID=UPI002AFDCB65|nr:MmcQ/YjbR family DNA-binding protein [Pararhodobacter sp.]
MTGAEFRAMALALPGTGEVPHFDRAAFRVRRIYASLAADGLSANLNLSPEEQAHYAALLPGHIRPVPNAWGARGWTEVTLPGLGPDALEGPLRAAWTRGSARRL